MRQLTKKQKKLLDTWYNDEDELYNWECLNEEQQEILRQINDTEILHIEVNRYLNDKGFKDNGLNNDLWRNINGK